MATQPAPLFDAATHAGRWIADYCARATPDDVLCADADAGWSAMFEELAAVASDDLGHARERVQRHAADIGTGFRIIGEADERPWPVSPVPLMIDADEWAGIARGVVQRAELMESVIADLYGAGRLVERGMIPAALVTGSPFFLRPTVGLEPPGGRHLNFVAIDLGRAQRIHRAELAFFADGRRFATPVSYRIQVKTGDKWADLPASTDVALGNGVTHAHWPAVEARQFRVAMDQRAGFATRLVEFKLF